jgi:hypothetical protein
MESENLFQVFSNIFIQSQQSFQKNDLELRSKCRSMSEKLKNLVEKLEEDPFQADLSELSNLEEEVLQILRISSELEDRREYIKESVASLKNSTQNKIKRK